MRRCSPSTPADDERGSAAIEFLVVGLLGLVPLAYLALGLGVVQGQQLGAASAARHIAAAVASAPDARDADARIERILAAASRDYGLDAASTEIAVECGAEVCPVAGEMVRVTVSSTVALPLIPPVLGLDGLARVAVSEQAAQRAARTAS